MQPDDVLFVAAAGPRLGFGHLVRASVLADALDVRRRLVLRGTVASRRVAERLGWSLETLTPGTALVVVDDPSDVVRSRWVTRAHREGVRAATIHDLGVTGRRGDLSIDGSVLRRPGSRPADLDGPRFAILRPAVVTARQGRTRRDAERVLIALGGGGAVAALGPAIARALVRAIPGVRVDIATGFAPGARPDLPAGCRWIDAPDGLAGALAGVTVAVVAGGMTLYEACAIGTPSVAVPVVASQRAAIRAFGRRGAVRAVDTLHRRLAVAQVTAEVAALLQNPRARAGLARRARALVDGGGATRVAARLASLRDRGSRRAA